MSTPLALPILVVTETTTQKSSSTSTDDTTSAISDLDYQYDDLPENQINSGDYKPLHQKEQNAIID